MFYFILEIFIATSAIRPRADVAYCIHALSRRLAKTHNWTVLFADFYDDQKLRNWMDDYGFAVNLWVVSN